MRQTGTSKLGEANWDERGWAQLVELRRNCRADPAEFPSNRHRDRHRDYLVRLRAAVLEIKRQTKDIARAAHDLECIYLRGDTTFLITPWHPEPE